MVRKHLLYLPGSHVPVASPNMKVMHQTPSTNNGTKAQDSAEKALNGGHPEHGKSDLRVRSVAILKTVKNRLIRFIGEHDCLIAQLT